ncbi:uroporphyrinogen-III C-methyltransferase [Sphingomonas sp. MMS12-HWE2-04]|uniref:uroporphyrinogen-III C-methyltransferase n=1 Tax=Sphingomonas sp. MMS12-HWE2-04 TaxID=3234199 RepID=UPI003850EFD7
MAEVIAPGEVWLVGAGPGDPDLLTRKAERLLGEASIVFYDALVGPGVLDLIPSHARRVAVGKRSGRHSQDQASINALLISAARAGERVVRLKGGDPCIFARAMEEVAALAAAGFATRICPGVTAGSAAAASAAISLSLRGLARRVQFVTAHAQADAPLEMDWAALVGPGCTTVFYMGRAAAGEISRELIGAGLDPKTPVLLACDVSLADEQLVQTRLDLLPLAAQSTAPGKPMVIVVGEAVASRRHAPIAALLEGEAQGAC